MTLKKRELIELKVRIPMIQYIDVFSTEVRGFTFRLRYTKCKKYFQLTKSRGGSVMRLRSLFTTIKKSLRSLLINFSITSAT